MMVASAGWPVSAATYAIDPRETTATFDVRFLGLIPLHGKFLRTTGTLTYDRATKQGSIEVLIDATTLVAGNVKAQYTARGPEFFEVEKYPSIEFRSSRFVFDSSRLKFIEGDLTLVGSTKRVILTVTDSRCDVATEHESARCRAVAELLVKRSVFGMKAWARAVSEEVMIRIVITARQAPEMDARTEPASVDSSADSRPLPDGRQNAGDTPNIK